MRTRRPDALLAAWGAWRPTTPPFVLHADRAVLKFLRSAGALVVLKGWREAYRDPDFPPRDSRLHLGLLPEPYTGNLRRASIYVLGLNPGVGPHNYYGEYEVPALRRALLANLKQKFGAGKLPFLFLDPQFSWHGGFEWWHGKLTAVIERLAVEWGVSFAAARINLARKLACLELVPYHSKTFSDPGGLAEGAVLVRPDGFVAWRTSTPSPAPVPTLVRVLSSILCRSAPSTRP